MTHTAEAVREDVWVHSICDMCNCNCGILVHRVDGVVTRIEGDPDSPHGGRLCAKGNAGLMGYYDPSRLQTPLKRTNPEKGIGVDPRWQPISWEEALDIAAKVLADVRADDPRKLAITTFDPPAHNTLVAAWASAFGTPNSHWVGYYCGNYLHAAMYMTNGTFHSDYDIDHCNYVILLGCQSGHMIGLSPMIMTQKMAEARARGMRLVAVDPVCSHAASKADEWVPLRPGTDAALVLAMINVLLNELACYDADFIRRHTNGPYLVRTDGLYVRDAEGKPQVWDSEAQAARPHDAAVTQPSLEGGYSVAGVDCRPAFALLQDHVRQFTPEWASRVTTIPAATIRRLAREFGQAAQIGATITVQGQTLAYRPAAVNIYRGAGAHKHGAHVALAVQTLNLIIGNFYRPGGHRGVNVVGPGWGWRPRQADGLMVPPERTGHGARYYEWDVKPPQTMGAMELFPISTNRSPMYQLSSMDPDCIQLPYHPEVLIACRRNHFLSNANHQTTVDSLKQFKYFIFLGTHLDEMGEFADLVFPDSHYLEKLELFPNSFVTSVTPASGQFFWGVRQPVIEPPPGMRTWSDTMYELADRVGFLGDVYRVINARFHLVEPFRLDPQKKYSRGEIYDRWAKSTHGADKGLDWFKEHGYHKVQRAVDEMFPLEKLGVRFPLYFENMLRAGAEVAAVTREMGLKWDTSDYVPLPVWKPCNGYRDEPGDDLYAVNYRIPTHYQTVSAQNPWLQEIARHNPYSQKILINTATARRLGLQDGEAVALQSEAGRVQGTLRVTELIHPEVVGMSGHFGAWARGKPVARGQGVNFNSLLPMGFEHMDFISAGIDACVRVQVTKV